MHALKHPAYRVRYQRNKKRLGRQRGAKLAQVDIARRLAHASWHMLTQNQPCAPICGSNGPSARDSRFSSL
jgi:transposase